MSITFTHGEQIQRCAIGPTGTLTSSGSLIPSNGSVIENLEITGNVKFLAGVTATFRNCRFIGLPTAPAGAYTIKATDGGGLYVILENCEIITRGAPANGLAMFGDGNVSAKRCIFRGGTDNVYLNPNNSPGLITSNDPDIPLARILLEECWFGDVQRTTGSHSDPIQIDGGGYAIVRRCRIMGYNIPIGTDPLTTTDGIELANCAMICTQNPANTNQTSYVKLIDSWLEGGNYTAYLNPPDGLPIQNVYASGNRFGIAHRYGPLLTPNNATRFGNIWGQNGSTVCCGTVAFGQILAGG